MGTGRRGQPQRLSKLQRLILQTIARLKAEGDAALAAQQMDPDACVYGASLSWPKVVELRWTVASALGARRHSGVCGSCHEGKRGWITMGSFRRRSYARSLDLLQCKGFIAIQRIAYRGTYGTYWGYVLTATGEAVLSKCPPFEVDNKKVSNKGDEFLTFEECKARAK